MPRVSLHSADFPKTAANTPLISNGGRGNNPLVGRALAVLAVLMLVFLGKPATAHPYEEGWGWAVTTAPTLIGKHRSSLLPGDRFRGTFEVPMPDHPADPRSSHGELHYYSHSVLTGIAIAGYTSGNPSELWDIFIDGPRSFGKLTEPLLNQAQVITFENLASIPTNGVILELTALGNHVFTVPEPETYALLLVGCAALAWRFRGRGKQQK